jgi:two-component system phosphate regulon sensor histidine kinase PhoR
MSQPTTFYALLICAALAIVFFSLWRSEVARARAKSSTQQQEYSRANQELQAELRTQERARRELEEVLASLQDAVLMCDSEAHLRFLNTAAVTLFNVRVEDVLGAQLIEALPSFGIEAAVRAAIDEERSSTEEVTLYTPRLREVLLRVAPVRREGNVAGAIVIVQDLTELRRLERMRRDFVSNASHELRTPVANIRAMVETLLDSPEDTQLTARFHPQIIAEAERLSRLVSDLLDLARLEKQTEEHGEASRDSIDLVPMVYEVLNRCKYKALDRHIELQTRFGPGCDHDVLVRGDAQALEQVVFNLLDNALMYTPSGGHVEIGVEGSAEGKVLLRVRDSGIGIPHNDLPRIFERFYRVDKARSRSQGGTGLGLAIVKHIVENHGGHIEVQSAEGEGSAFTVVLPAL